MNEISHILREEVIKTLNPIIVNFDQGFYYALDMDFGGSVGQVIIPIFDERVNPAVELPDLMGSKAYVLIRDQQEIETTNDKCSFRQNALITIDCICKFPPNVGSKYAAELISAYIQPLMASNIEFPGWQNMSVRKVNSQSIVEQGVNATAYRKILTYSFDVYELNN